ncbi:macrophage mannose receptor 1 [Haplochromis burtoni]|uniref:macrophage mannose receptor 1 n=1 Tax=Haplochromis burtoni TaxID=8153 RepID=UPI001C2DB76E|nr:macrophage mannose receptor 1 [Haplochromis burtoni]
MCLLIRLLLFISPVCGDLLNFKPYSGSYMTTWTKAQTFCRKYHTDLITIRNEQENTFFKSGGWIGLYRANTNTWKWSRGDEIASFIKWDSSQPSQNGDCVYKHDGVWWTHGCHYNHSFMCYDEKLVLVKENKTWEEALNHCRSLGAVDTNDPNSPYRNHRYDLATLITTDDHTYARERAQQATTDEVWTGLCNLAGEWLWVGGGQMQYENIPSCPTNGFCGVLEKSGTASYGIRNCQQRRNFFCYIKP